MKEEHKKIYMEICKYDKEPKEVIINLIEELEKYKNMYKAEHEIHLVRNEQLERKERGIQKSKETIAKLSFELGKYQAKLEEDEAVIEEMANYIKEPYEVRIIGSRKPKIEIIKEYFRNKAKGEKE